MSPIISIENLSKCYLVGHQSAQRERYTSLRDVLARNTKNFLRNGRDMMLGRQVVHGDDIEEFWALKDVSVEIERGDVVGIIGRNGAGKSTLLKILSRITEPTGGRITLRGRVASLLEVGTGFHPELTGRENIFLNGAILGMTRAEIMRKFDEIVGFSEVERFLDTPVKRYSSGMYVRLAFSVAAHLDPEILIVDEVLAVGDSQFQKKCLGKLKDVTGSGRTVLFVSHNMAAIKALCTRAMLLRNGTLVMAGEVDHIVDEYFRHSVKNETTEIRRVVGRLTYVSFCEVIDHLGAPSQIFFSNDAITIRFRFQSVKPITGLRCGVRIVLSDGATLLCYTPEDEGAATPISSGDNVVSVTIPNNTLLKGHYKVSASLWNRSTGEIYDEATEIASFQVEPAPERAYLNEFIRPGLVQTSAKWLVSNV